MAIDLLSTATGPGRTAARVARQPATGRRRSTWLAVGLAAVAMVGWAARDVLWPKANDDIIVERAKLGKFVHNVVERGDVESSANIDVVCEVQSQNAEGVRILQVVAEGTFVKEGDFLVKLDDAKLRTDRATQRIAVSTAEAALSQAKNELAANKIAKDEYEFGTFRQEEKKLESEMLVAEENIRRARNALKFSERMLSRGYIDQLKLDGDRFAVDKNVKELEVAQVKLEVLRTYTRAKTLKKHESDISTSEAKVRAETAKLEIETDKLAQIESQLAKCEIRAPIAGQVVYPEMERWRGNAESAIRAGTRVREQQVIIRLPDSKHMQVKAKISEARVDRVKPGMNVEIRLDALPGVELRGRVTKVNPYPSNDNWFMANIKEYAAFVEIVDAPAALRSGMSAHVTIEAETIDSALQVPVQAVVERGGKYYCVLREANSKLAARELLLGSSNDKFLVVREGLAEGQVVVLNPRAHLDQVGLPAIDVQKPKPAAAGKPPQVAERQPVTAASSTKSDATASSTKSDATASSTKSDGGPAL